MRLFVSWSGAKSKAVAGQLAEWLKLLFQQDVETYMSAHDVEAGERWTVGLADELERSDYAVLCLTPDNLDARWILFEAGAVSRSVESGRVVPVTQRATTRLRSGTSHERRVCCSGGRGQEF